MLLCHHSVSATRKTSQFEEVTLSLQVPLKIPPSLCQSTGAKQQLISSRAEKSPRPQRSSLWQGVRIEDEASNDPITVILAIPGHQQAGGRPLAFSFTSGQFSRLWKPVLGLRGASPRPLVVVKPGDREADRELVVAGSPLRPLDRHHRAGAGAQWE